MANLGDRTARRGSHLRRRGSATFGRVRAGISPALPVDPVEAGAIDVCSLSWVGSPRGQPATAPPFGPLDDPSGEHVPVVSAQVALAPVLSGPPHVPSSGRDAADDILSALMAVEVLSPRVYSDHMDLAEGDARQLSCVDAQLPWEGSCAKSWPRTRPYYQVVLGAIRMEKASEALLSVFIDRQPDRQRTRGLAPIATVTLDQAGRPISPPAVVISSFAWGLPFALKQDLDALSKWPQIQVGLVAGLDDCIRRFGENGALLPLDCRTINEAFTWLTEQLGLDRSLTEEPRHVRRIDNSADSLSPDTLVLGSTFLTDLDLARRLFSIDSAPGILRRFLGIERPVARRDVLKDRRAIAAAVAPNAIPPARWPVPNSDCLALLEQGAVNLAASGLPDTSLLAIHEPPGTGANALLRDLISAVIVRRAEAMAAFDDPAAAFVVCGEKVRVGRRLTQVYHVDQRLRGFEILVICPNSEAAAKTCRHLSLSDAVAAGSSLRYFNTVSDNAAGREETWGLAAVPLVDDTDRTTFSNAVWADKERGLQTYLAEAAGTPQWLDDVDAETGQVTRRRKPEVVARENPPKDQQTALRCWRSARGAFRRSLAEMRRLLDDLNGLASAEEDISRLRQAALMSDRAASIAAVEAANAQRELELASARMRACAEESAQVTALVAGHELQRPGRAARLFATRSARVWGATRAALAERLERSVRDHAEASALLARAQGRRSRAERDAAQAKAEQHQAVLARDDAERRRAELRRGDTVVVDETFFARGHDQIQLSTPWLDAATQRIRDQVFVRAVALHKAFIDAAAQPLRRNLEALQHFWSKRAASSARFVGLMPELWSTLFLVVPSVTTTFSSIESLLRGVGPEQLGWLVINGAEQAVPQAAIGALMRTRRAIAFGDPMQLGPTTTLPSGLVDRILSNMTTDAERFSPSTASVQTLANAAGRLGAELEHETGSTWVGWPLLVHRSCAEPMFSLANRIAGAGLMVRATPMRRSPIRDVLGTSTWFDLPHGKTEDEWCEAEGRILRSLLAQLGEANVPELDLLIISPFASVAQKLREQIAASGLLKPWTDSPWHWTRDRIATVRAVQDRQADSVFLVLGAALPSQRGARALVGQRPNFLNVAVTRARENLYVIGSRAAWHDAGVFRHLVRALKSYPQGGADPLDRRGA